MNKQIIFIGGSKGVGKTSLARAVSEELNLEYINTGDRFRKYRPQFDKKFCQELIDLDHGVLIDTHYAASSSKTPYDLNIGLDEKYQMHLRFNSNYGGKIILIEASPEVILERRAQNGDPRRCLDIEQIVKENNFNSAYSKIYASCLNLSHHIFKNEGFSIDKSIIKLSGLIKNE
ncbi:hypothetical protein CMI46_01460 [Candidatus Pacearchaeota archaeon]|nr:hypothetical protein [Candidatus Pacearchaeota archaeon]|tara:strand:- start:23579 stop:24103 length:525 start_codon:yes stop_codon:yes gene_type:complete